MKTWMVAMAMVSLAGMALASPDELEDARGKLKTAVDAKDADTVKTTALETAKLAQAVINAPKPSDAADVDNWQKRIEYGKEVVAYAEYALGFTASQGLEPAKTVELMDALLTLNPKSKYVDVGVQGYLVALGKSGGAAKQLEGMNKVVAGRPDNEIALQALADGYFGKERSLGYANRLVAAARANKKPEGFPDADWEKAKTSFLASGYYDAGAANCSKSSWVDCDRDLKAALPLIQGENARLGPAYYLLGLANFQFGKQTMDRTRMQAGEKYTEQSAAIAGPMQGNARQNVNAMKTELAAPHR